MIGAGKTIKLQNNQYLEGQNRTVASRIKSTRVIGGCNSSVE
jgi:hypothetical protein